MNDFTNCPSCGALVDDKVGTLCGTCKSREETPFPINSIARYFGQRVRVDAVDGTLRTVTHIDSDDNPVSEDEAPQEAVGVERLSPDYRRWTGQDELRVGDVVIVDGDTTDDFYARIVDVELNNRAWFVITDKHGTQEDDEPDEYYISPNNRALPWADPIPNRMIASFAPVEPLPFDGPVQDDDYPATAVPVIMTADGLILVTLSGGEIDAINEAFAQIDAGPVALAVMERFNEVRRRAQKGTDQ